MMTASASAPFSVDILQEPSTESERPSDMAGLTAAEWENVQARIDRAVSDARDKLAKELNPKGIPQWLKESIPIVLLGAIGVFVLKVTIPALIDSKINTLRSDLAKDMDPKFDAINKRIDDALRDALNSIVGRGGGPTKDGKKNTLSVIEKGEIIIRMASDLDRRIDVGTLQQFSSLVSDSLRSNPQSLPSWKTAAALINYKSRALSQSVGTFLDLQAAMGMPRCATGTGGFANIGFDANFKCSFDLGAELGLDNVTLKNAVVFYNGGPIRARNLTLDNCYFVINVAAIPPPRAREAIERVLASNNNSVQVGTG
jgi:hypothetical protein